MCMPDLPQAWRDGFDEVAELYDRVRPGYPDDLLDELAAVLPRSPVVVEVGPGTGQATKGLVARGARVTAVELGAHLAAVLARNLPTVDVVIGPFENVDLAPGSFDAVVAASSYHWVPPEARMTRPAALLRPGGHLALIALNQVASPADRGFFDEVHHVFSRHGLPGTHDPVPTHEELVPSFVDEIVALPDRQIFDALVWVMERCKLVVEGAAAAPVAALLNGLIDLPPGSRVAVVLSGGNLNLDQLRGLSWN